MRSVLFVLIGVAAVATARAADPPVTDPRLPSAADEAAKRWVLATFEATVFDCFPNAKVSSAGKMMSVLRSGKPVQNGVAWFTPPQNRYGWSWFLERYDTDGDKRITKEELGSDLFARLDRDRNGVITAEDFDWSDNTNWAKLNGISTKLFRTIDRDKSGKVSEQEMLDYFKKLAGDKGHFTADDLRDALIEATAVPVDTSKPKEKEQEGPEPGWMKGLFASDLGSPFDGPGVGQDAPDFTLPTQDGKKKLTLSDYRDNRPVVLIFGSFT